MNDNAEISPIASDTSIDWQAVADLTWAVWL